MTMTVSSSVFLIGMRINSWWRPDLWLPVFNAMPGMLAELSKDRDSGLLGYRLTIGAGGPLVVQYWSSHEKLYAYASERDAAHRPAWAAFNRRARKAPGQLASGTRHIRSPVPNRSMSACPTMGLAKATEIVPVRSHGERSAGRRSVDSIEHAAIGGRPRTADTGGLNLGALS